MHVGGMRTCGPGGTLELTLDAGSHPINQLPRLLSEEEQRHRGDREYRPPRGGAQLAASVALALVRLFVGPIVLLIIALRPVLISEGKKFVLLAKRGGENGRCGRGRKHCAKTTHDGGATHLDKAMPAGSR